MSSFNKSDLLFLPLGGSNEIGMNVNLYHYQGKWLMIDLGAGFADEHYPGISMLAPDLSFIYERKKDFLGVVLTHAHEDHLGSVGYLWDQLQCPIYATPFTAGLVRHKLAERGYEKDASITIVQPGSAFDVGPFSLEMIQITHSIPEMNGIVLKTEYGNILHTGDWKLDPNPVIGETTDEKALKALGDEGVLAMVCDSTNVFNDRHSGSEGALEDSLAELIEECKNMVIVTTFASNVARLQTIAKAAHRNGRKVGLAGLSLWRVSTIARDAGYLKDLEPFLSEAEMKETPRDKLLVICTGCQGEPNAAMNKIAHHRHPGGVRLSPGDTVIFSSKIIPGNEKRIFRLFNTFVRSGVEVYTEKDHFVHVSGHPSREELRQMYEWVRPQMAIPVHGEPMHLHEHVKFARFMNVPQPIEIQNGEIIKLAPGKAESITHVTSGYLAVDGKLLHPRDGNVMKMRRKLQNDGIVIVTITLNMNGKLSAEPGIIAPGVLDIKEERSLIRYISEELIDTLDAQRDTSDDNIYKATRNTLRRIFKEELGKSAPIEILITHV